jgi:hypothetical protein
LKIIYILVSFLKCIAQQQKLISGGRFRSELFSGDGCQNFDGIRRRALFFAYFEFWLLNSHKKGTSITDSN